MEWLGRPSVLDRRRGGTRTSTHITARMTNTKGVTLRAYLLARRPYRARPLAWWMVVTSNSVPRREAGATRARTLRFYYENRASGQRGRRFLSEAPSSSVASAARA